MLKLDPTVMQALNASQSASDLHFSLQKAIELEHSTIPPYLTAIYSMMPNSNEDTKEIIRSISREEMLHFNIACNILIALGGKPNIFYKSFAPDFPSVLPLNIANSLVVGLDPVSKQVVETIFMEIEKPETPLNFPVKEAFRLSEEFVSIGEFYRLIQQKINELPDEHLPGDPSSQVIGLFPPQHLFPILEKKDAIRAIDLIIDQGEGTSTTPLGKGEELAHYYRFNEIVKGKQLIRDTSAPEGFSYSGAPIFFDEAMVYPLFPNTKARDLPAGSAERKIADDFNICYTGILQTLHETFNGSPDMMGNAFNQMFELSDIASRLVSLPFPGKEGFHIGPPFEIIID